MKAQQVGVGLSILAAFITMVLAEYATSTGYDLASTVLLFNLGMIFFAGSMIVYSGEQKIGAFVIIFSSIIALSNLLIGSAPPAAIGGFYGGIIGLIGGVLSLTNSKKK